MDELAIKRIQPHSNEAEQAIIGAILMDRDVISEVSDKLSRDDFYNAQYGILYEAMNELYNEGKEIDVISLSNRLKTKDVPEEVSSLGNHLIFPIVIADNLCKSHYVSYLVDSLQGSDDFRVTIDGRYF